MNIKDEIKNETDVFFTVTGKEKYLSELNTRLLDLFKKWALEIVGEDTDDRPEITEWIVMSKEETKGYNLRAKEIRERIEK